jgi:hypothetical protein
MKRRDWSDRSSVTVKKKRGADRAIDTLWLHATLGVVDMEATGILRRCRVRPTLEKLSEAPHEPDIITLCVLP